MSGSPESPSRRSTRVSVPVAAAVTTPDGVQILGVARDLSVKGLAVDTEVRLPPGTRCTVVLFLEGGLGTVRVEAEGTVVRSDGSGLGLELGAVQLDSLEHLRKLVLYNSADPATIEREFERHQGILRVGGVR